MRKIYALLSLLVVLSMALAACGPTTETAVPSTGAADKTTFVDAVADAAVDTLDPALAYDTASAEVIFNVYETLVFFDGEATDKFVPQLAESYELSEDGTTWTFHIRSGVKFHDGGDLTASDVAYSYQRGLLQGGYASAQWLLAEPFFGIGNDDMSVVIGNLISAKLDAKADELVAAADLATFIADPAPADPAAPAPAADAVVVSQGSVAFAALFTELATYYTQISGFAVDAAAILADEANVTTVNEMIAGLATAADDAAKQAAIRSTAMDLLAASPYDTADDRDAMIAVDAAVLKEAADMVLNAIVADDAAGTVTMTLTGAWGPFLPTIAQTWGAIMDKEWVIANGGWDGSADTWQNFYGMTSEENPFSAIANGTGPFKLEKLANGEEIILVRNDNYWREPAKLERIVIRQVAEWGTRFTMMQTGDADTTDVPVENRPQMDPLAGERCEFDLAANDYKPCEVIDESQPFRLSIGRPGIAQDVILFNMGLVAEGNSYIGSGALDGNGIPVDFFLDVHMRRAFAYAFDWDTFITDVYNGEAVQSLQLHLPGMPGYSLDTPHYTFDLAASEAEFKLADLDHDGIAAGDDPEGDVWTTGFRLQMMYNQGNTTRQIVAEIMAANISQVNELFSVEILGLPFAAYLRAQRAHLIPIMTGGWLEDIHDAHNWYQPYTVGAYGARQGLTKELRDQIQPILNAGVSETDPAKRHEIYVGLNQLYHDQAIGVPVVLTTSHGFSQRWVKGLITNPIFPGIYYYPVYKQ